MVLEHEQQVGLEVQVELLEETFSTVEEKKEHFQIK